MIKLIYAGGIFTSFLCFSQDTKPKINASFFDGIVAAGYADHGAFINFIGPNISFKNKNLKLMLGMLPSLRIKQDRSEGTRNSAVMPTLGAGVTVVYRKFALQVPVYYNTKTASLDGAWKAGIGLGYSFR